MKIYKKAFTIIELMVAISIVSILTIIWIVSFMNYSSQTRDSVRLSHISDIESVIELYSVFSGWYPRPSQETEVTASWWTTVWIQWVFGSESMNETRKIFWDVVDPLHGNFYPYSITTNKREFQLWYILEWSDRLNNQSFLSSINTPQVTQSYANTFFNPSMFEPAVWLDANDINWDGSVTPEGAVITTWVNKWTRWSSANGTRTHGTITYQTDAVWWMPAVFVPRQAGLLFNNSSISQWEIYFVLHDSWWRATWYWLQGTSWNYVLWSYHNFRNSLRINNTPNHLSTAPAIRNQTRRESFFYSFVTDWSNYEFRNTGNFLSQWPTNSISWVTWAFNRAWNFTRTNELADWGVWELLIFDSELSEEAQFMVEGYLAHTWGLADILPLGHPYRESPPTVGVTPADTTPPISSPTQIVEAPWYPTFIRWNYNRLFTHSISNEGLHKVFVTPSIIASDLSVSSFENILDENKLVYTWFWSIPAWYNIPQNTPSNSLFPFNLDWYLAFSWTRFDLASYRWMREIEQFLRFAYRYSPVFWDVSWFFSSIGTQYVEDILSRSIGVNPIRPYYCQEILERRLIDNLAPDAIIDASSTASNSWFPGTSGISNGNTSAEWQLNIQYRADAPGWFIEFNWDRNIPVWFIRIHNSLWSLSSWLSQAEIQLFRNNDSVPAYTHTLWNTTGDFIIDLDIEGLGYLFQDIRRIRIIAHENRTISLREVEIFAGGSIQDGYYKVDSDWIWWRGSYTIYCDMTTDWGGWTKIWDNFIDRSFFEWSNHPSGFSWFRTDWSINNINHNTLRSDIVWPADFPEAIVLQHTWWVNSLYRLEFSNIPDVEFTTEVRLSAWVRWSLQSPFSHTITYHNQSPQVSLISDIYDWDVSQWRYETIRIPITDYLETFYWDIGAWINAWVNPLQITWLKLEVFYK